MGRADAGILGVNGFGRQDDNCTLFRVRISFRKSSRIQRRFMLSLHIYSKAIEKVDHVLMGCFHVHSPETFQNYNKAHEIERESSFN